jgi:hypothetical protein
VEHQDGVKQIYALIVKNMQSLTKNKKNQTLIGKILFDMIIKGKNKILRRQGFQRWMLKINNKYVKDDKQMLAAYKKIK